MDKEIFYLSLGKYILLLGSLMATLLRDQHSMNAVFILLALALLSNSQLRSMYLKNRGALVSLFLEIGLIIYLGLNYQGFVYLLIFSTLLDAFLLLKAETYFISLLAGIALFFLTINRLTVDVVIALLLLYVAHNFLLLQLRRELGLRQEVEYLNDNIRLTNYELEAARARLMEHSRQIEKITQLEERNRISRELHDSLGHSLTGMLYQADAAQQVMEQDPEKGKELLASLYNNINNCIISVREAVYSINPGTSPGYLLSLEELIRNFRKTTGVNVEFKSWGTSYRLQPSVEIAIYRNCQEALTNVVRHGKAKNIFIDLTYSKHDLKLIIRDDGKGATKIIKGLGLSGMEERVQLVGGSITFSSQEGFKVEMIVPREEM